MACGRDQNTNFILSLFKHRGGIRSLFSMQVSDDIIYDPDGIDEHVVFYYQHLFSNPDDGTLDFSIVW